MIEPEELESELALEHRLGLARRGFSPSAEVEARVWGGLAERHGLSARPAHRARSEQLRPVIARGTSKWATLGLMGLSFAAGFWVRAHTSPVAESPPAAPPIALSPAPSPAAGSEAANRAGGALEEDAPQVGSASPSGETAPFSGVEAPAASSALGEAPETLAPAPQRDRAAPVRARPAPVGPRAPVPRPGSRHRDELRLLERVERALRAHRPALALSLLDELDERFPRSRLGEERAAARVLAECARADVLAPSRAALFLRDQPGSVYSDRIRRACDLESSAPAESAEGPPQRGH